MIFTSVTAQFVNQAARHLTPDSAHSTATQPTLSFKVSLIAKFLCNWVAALSTVLIITQILAIILNHSSLQILCSAILIYSVIAWKCFQQWLKVVQRYPELDSEEKLISNLVLAIATVFWPLTVPLSWLETRFKH